MTLSRLSRWTAVVTGAVMAAAPGWAQTEPAPPQGGSEQELAKKLANPVASLISVPLQENLDFGIGPNDGVRSTLNIQPVIPIAIADDWNLIIRTIVPLTYQNDVTGPTSDEFGLGDTTQSFFFSPASSRGGVIWAIGPVLAYPTATDRALGSEKWGAGPTGLILKQAGKNTFGLLANHIWSFAGDDDRNDISSTFIQPFFSHTTAKATTFGINAETSYDWKGDNWVVPINLTVTQLTKLGEQPISVGGGVRYYVEKPEGGPDWGIRLIFTLLFPKS